MRREIANRFGEEFVQLGQGSLNQEEKAAIIRLANGNEVLRRSMLTEFSTFIMLPIELDNEFHDTQFKTSELWSLSDDACYGTIKGPLSALQKNPAGASGGVRNHKAAKRVHCRSRARLDESKVEIGTAILFNSRQLDRRIATTRKSKICQWLNQLGPEDEDQVEVHSLQDDDDETGDRIEEFDRVNISGGIEGISDEDIFEEEVLEEGEISV